MSVTFDAIKFARFIAQGNRRECLCERVGVEDPIRLLTMGGTDRRLAESPDVFLHGKRHLFMEMQISTSAGRCIYGNAFLLDASNGHPDHSFRPDAKVRHREVF